MDLSEFNPRVDAYRTGRLVANMFYYFTLGVAQRGKDLAPESESDVVRKGPADSADIDTTMSAAAVERAISEAIL